MRGIAIVLVAAVFTALAVQLSFRQGRLSAVPNYDDAVYFLSATRLIEAGRAEGMSGAAEELRSEGLHSPWSLALAGGAFLTLGYAEWGPYAFNVLVVIAFLAALSWMWRELRWREWGCGMVFFLATPFATLAVVEFRPDLVWAVAVGFCGVYGLVVPGYLDRMRPRLIHAVLCAAALLVKPSTFAMTLIVFGYSVGVRVVLDSVIAKRTAWREIGRTAGWQALVIVGLTAVYVFPFGADTWHYFWTNSFGANEAIWRAPVTVAEKWLYYGVGFGAANNLGWAGALLVGVVGWAVWMSWRRRSWEGVSPWVALGGLVLLTYGLSSGFGMKSPFLGGAFIGCFLFAGAFAWGEVFGIAGVEVRTLRTRKWFAVGLALVSVLIWRWPPYAWAQAGESGRNFSEVQNQVIDVIEKLPLRNRVRLLFSQSGPLMRENVEMWLLRSGHETSAVKGGFLPTADRFKQKMRRADLVFVQDSGMRDSFANLPGERVMGEFVKSVQAADEFELAGEAVGMDGGKVYVYVRKSALR